MEQYQRNWKDYYEILQVSPNAEPEVIAAAYRRLAQLYHPDTAKKLNASARMADINEAYEVLSNSNKRMEYHQEFNRRQTGGVTGANIQNAPKKSSESHNSDTRSYYEQEPIWTNSTQVGDESANIGFFKVLGIGIAILAAGIYLMTFLVKGDPAKESNVSLLRLISLVILIVLGSVLRKTWRK